MKSVLGLNKLLGNISRDPAQETGFSQLSAQTATQLLKFISFKITVVHELQPCDPNNRVNFCNWILQSVHDYEINSYYIFYHKASFNLHMKVNSKNSRYWSLYNLGLTSKVPLHNSKTGVWCDVILA
jgi:hypothetical protein